MKKFLWMVVLVMMTVTVTESCSAQRRRDLTLNLEDVNHPSTLRAFKDASAQNQLENLIHLLRQADEVYYQCTDVDELYVLDTKMDGIWQLIEKSDESFSQVEADFKILRRKITRSISEAENSVLSTQGTVRRLDKGQRSYEDD